MQKQFDAFANAQLLLCYNLFYNTLKIKFWNYSTCFRAVLIYFHSLSTEQCHSLPHIRQNRDLGDNLSYPLLTGVTCNGRGGKDVHVFVSK